MYGTRVNGAGSVLDGAGFAISTGGTAERAPAVAAGPGNKFRVAYQRFAAGPPYGSHRVFLKDVAPK
jgi:hypothetical protein